ncbi:hypothetical protein Sste5346_009588 [Sporothrix stenoceras]|uniref:DUF7924 domain-containing protein n=1 Tax=Sporothrix stenoceras TaxID=5173 RepID=A0ABR3YJ90_9PEZI
MGGRVSKRSGPSATEPVKQEETFEDPSKTASPARASPASRKRRQPEDAAADIETPAKRSRLNEAAKDTEADTPRSRSRPRPRRGKRRAGSDKGADDDKNDNPATKPTKRARLTRRNLAQLDKMNRSNKRSKGSKGSKSRGDTNTDATTTKTGTTRVTTTSTTSSGFDVQGMKNGILEPEESKPPANLQEIRERMAKPRESASPPASEYECYVDNVKHAGTESTMVFDVGIQLLKRHWGNGYYKSMNQAFTAFPKDVGFNNNLSSPQPDFVEGLAMREYMPFPVDQEVPGAVLYKDSRRSITLPHLAGEWKGTGKDMTRAAMQSAYDGAALVYARNQALDVLGTPDKPGHAEITTFTTDGSHINFYAHYATTEDKSGKLQYHQYPVESERLVHSYEEHKAARRSLRNEQDHAKTKSYALRDRLKKHWGERREVVNEAVAADKLRSKKGKSSKADDNDTGGLKRKASSTSTSSRLSSHGEDE